MLTETKNTAKEGIRKEHPAVTSNEGREGVNLQNGAFYAHFLGYIHLFISCK